MFDFLNIYLDSFNTWYFASSKYTKIALGVLLGIAHFAAFEYWKSARRRARKDEYLTDFTQIGKNTEQKKQWIESVEKENLVKGKKNEKTSIY